MKNVLNEINLKIEKNEKIALLGKSGVGISTFIDLLSGLIHPNSGSIRIDNQDINRNNSSLWSKNISYIPQNDFFVDSSILNNIILGSKETAFDKKRLDWVCKIAMIDEFLNDKKLSLELNMERMVLTSGGQKQRIGIARIYENLIY